MLIRRFFAALISASVAWGGFVLADQPAAYAICSDPCGGGGGYDPTVHAFVDLTVQGINATSSVGSLTGGHLASACTSSCTDSWSDTLSSEEATETYTVSVPSGWTVDHWTGCTSGGGTTTSCTMSPVYSTSSTKTSDNTAAVAVYLRDISAPTAQFTVAPAEGSYTGSQGFSFQWSVNGTGTPVTTRCRLDSGTYFSCSTWYAWNNVAEGPHTFSLEAIDGGGNVTIITRHFTVDRTPPSISIDAGPSQSSYVASNSVTFNFSGSDVDLDHANCGDGATDAAHVSATRSNCGYFAFGIPVGWSETLSGLPEGIHTWTVQMLDKAGNLTQTWRTWYVDTVEPTASFTGGPDAGATTSDTAPTFNFTLDGTGSGATATCQLDGPVSFSTEACTSDASEALSGLTDGDYTLTLHVIDQAGNTADVTRAFHVNTSIPTLSISSGPEASSYIGSTSATWTFTAGNGATNVSCSFDGEIQRPCSGGTTSDTVTNMTDGQHSWTVRAVNSAATAISVTRTFFVDTLAPTASFTGGPADGATINSASPVFAWTDDGTGSPATVACTLDGVAVDCTTPTSAELSSLAEGQHTFTVDVTDATGHSIDISRTFTVDLTPPSIQLGGGPADGDAIATHSVTYFFSSENGATFLCSLDGADPAPCSNSGSDTRNNLAEGNHSWQVQASDAAGNVTTVTRSFTVDTTAPTAAFTAGVADQGYTNDATPEFDFTVDGTGSDASVACATDGANGTPCTSATSYVTQTLGDGQHTVHVVVTDAAGNTVTITRTFTVDTVAPGVTVLSGPANNGAINTTAVTFGFSADNGTSLGCSLDAGDYVLCTGTGADTTTGLTEGTHTWRVRATDAAGNHTVVSRAFTVDLTKPSISSTTSWRMFTLGRTLTFAWTPTDAVSGIASSDVQVQHASPSSGFGSWSSPSSWTATTAHKVSLSASRGYTYCFHVRTRDKAGNTSGWAGARCTTLPLDDVSLKHSTHWKKVSGSGFYAGSVSQTSTRGATLTSGTVAARHVSLLVTTCKGCGTVGVYRGSTLLKKISLAATKTHRQVLITVWSGSSVRTGAIRIKVLSTSGHLVQIDGLAVTRR